MEYLLFLQNVRENMNPAFNYFMNATSDFVINNGMLFLLFVVSYIFDKRLGRKICFGYGFNIFMSVWAKNVACISRPWIRDSRIIPAEGMIKTAGGFSFPSGHATIAGSLFVPLFVYVKNNIIKIISILAILLVCFSRNYVGVHTLEDVVVGLLIAIIGCMILFKVMDYIEKDEFDGKGHTKDKVNNRDIIICIITLIICILGVMYSKYKVFPATAAESEIADAKKQMLPMGVMMVGALLGIILERRFVRYDNDASLVTKIIRVIVGYLVIYLISTYVSPMGKQILGSGSMIKYATMMFNITFLIPFIFTTYEKLLKLK